MPVAALDTELADTLGASFLADLDDAARDDLVGRCEVINVEEGRVCIRPDGDSIGGIVIRGIFRVFVMAADGRRMTVRYARHGAMVGLVSGLGELPAPVFVQAVTSGRLLTMRLRDVEDLAVADGAVAWAFAREISTRLRESIESLADASFGTLRGRIARVLFDHATSDGDKLVTHLTQQEIAEHLGTAREVVARNLGQLRDSGLVRLARGAVTIVDAERLAEMTGGWQVGPYWTLGGGVSVTGSHQPGAN